MDFLLTNDKRHLVKNLSVAGKIIQIKIRVNQDNFSTVENTNFVVIEEVLKLIQNNLTELLWKADKFLRFLIDNSGLYERETIKNIKGFNLIAVEIIEPFGKHVSSLYINYLLQFDFNSESHVDTYGLLNVKFMNEDVTGVERIQV